MQKIHIDVPGVTFGGVDAAVGTVVEVSDKGFKALVMEGKGRPVDADGKPVSIDPAELPSDEEIAAKAAADLAKTKKALDDQYKLDELKEAAKAAGVDFPYDAKKGDIIEAIIAQGKAAELLK